MIINWTRVSIITFSAGALARSKGKSTFVKITHRITLGRMGRGDTVMGSYLARRRCVIPSALFSRLL
jgi:hypothetical protein